MSDEVIVTRVCEETAALMQVRVSRATAQRYLQLHAVIPARLTCWPRERLTELVDELADDDSPTWERVLILLGHHGSEAAVQILCDLAQQVPVDLREFAELAYAESLTWIGVDYVRVDPAGPIALPCSGAVGGVDCGPPEPGFGYS